MKCHLCRFSSGSSLFAEVSGLQRFNILKLLISSNVISILLFIQLKVWILIGWVQQKSADLDLKCFEKGLNNNEYRYQDNILLFCYLTRFSIFQKKEILEAAVGKNYNGSTV